MQLDELRAQIDRIDDEILALFKRRMEAGRQAGQYKRERGLPVFDRERERDELYRVASGLDPEMTTYGRVLFTTLFEMSRSYQNRDVPRGSHTSDLIGKAIDETPTAFPDSAVVACQGVEGAYSQAACDRLFALPKIMYVNSFEGVFQAVDGGLCRFGVLPLENSTAGSVNEVYDLMNRYRFHIVRSVRLKIQHTLLAPAGAKLADVKEIFSHEQAIRQCGQFLGTLKGVKITACENTAVAAKRLAESGRADVAAISSESCAEQYGLSVLSYNIANSDSNYTRFICISKKTEIYPGANRTSLMLSLKNEPGSLYSVLAKFNALGVNLIKLESRPIPGSDFEFMFYFDIDASVYSEALREIVTELEQESALFNYLGSYQEM